MRRLASYACGEWLAAPEGGQLLRDAVNGEPVALIGSEGLDFQAMLDHARHIGGPALRHHSFHQRALMLKELGKYLMAHKENLYAESWATGATRNDAWIDIEGGISTLFSYSGKGRRELPNAHLCLDGAQERISRAGSFTAQHVLSPLHGVAIHINAFNFPCWGMLEKLAPTLLAGVPAIVKPARQTAWLAETLFRHIIDADILPEGAVQLVCGGTGDLLDRLDYQDVVSFTGSHETGLMLKQTPAIVGQGTRFLMEADSLNCSILGRDASPGSEAFARYVRELAREMTVKAGQKCTAIRRALVPREYIEAVADALGRRLQETTIGNPRNERVRMGALAGMEQREAVLERIRLLARDNEILYGSDLHIDPLEADAESGAFLPPVLLLAEDAATSSAHDIEAFGPVCTLLPYHDEEEAIELAALGRGSLVGSIVTEDPAIATRLCIGAAPHHGRLLVLDSRCAAESTGHGSPLPQLIHGGPGRAGGSEELGGIRGVSHYMQRTALQGSPEMLTAITGQWMQGAERRFDSERHPFRKHFEELEIGDAIITGEREITLRDIERFAELSGDRFYAHMDEDAARRNPFFEGRVAHGYFLVSLAAGLFVWPDEGPVLANYGLDNLRFTSPVYAGDRIRVQFTCKQKTDREGEPYGEVRWYTSLVNQNDEAVANYDVLTLVAKKQR
jgi:oxepin-CoA hydrolase/3-oxo-5,6-dehydrosuberyl-CoA semialdehyde dehydrogenase